MISNYLLLVEEEKRDKVAYIYQNNYKYMLYKVRSIIDDESSAEDVVHDTMLKIIDNLDKIDCSDKDKLKNLCMIMAEQKSIDFLRKKRSDLSVEELPEESDDSHEPQRYLMEKVGVEQIVDAIYKLNGIYRLPCELKYLYGYKEREIAELLDLSPKLVNSRIFRAKNLIREYIKEKSKKP